MPEDFNNYRDLWYELEGQMFGAMSAIMTYSDFVKNTLIKEYGVSGEKVYTIGSSLKIHDDIEIDWNLRENKALFVTTDFNRKGGYELVNIFDEIVKDAPNATLTVVGNMPAGLLGDKRPWLKHKGAVDRKELVEIYKESSLLVHPAKYDAFPSVILEAANFEIPTVATGICGIPEMILDGVTGYLAKPGDYPGFRNKISQLLGNKGILEKMGKSAKEFVRGKFHPKIVAQNMANVINGYL